MQIPLPCSFTFSYSRRTADPLAVCHRRSRSLLTPAAFVAASFAWLHLIRLDPARILSNPVRRFISLMRIKPEEELTPEPFKDARNIVGRQANKVEGTAKCSASSGSPQTIRRCVRHTPRWRARARSPDRRPHHSRPSHMCVTISICTSSERSETSEISSSSCTGSSPWSWKKAAASFVLSAQSFHICLRRRILVPACTKTSR